MPSRDRHSPHARWPFWLLLVAWLCANTPQTAVFVGLTWVAEARSFSHQERLTRDVAFLLNGETAPGIVAAASELPQRPTPPVPAQLVLKKVDLSLERACEVLPPAWREATRFVSIPAPGGLGRAAPPTEPPRSA